MRTVKSAGWGGGGGFIKRPTSAVCDSCFSNKFNRLTLSHMDWLCWMWTRRHSHTLIEIKANIPYTNFDISSFFENEFTAIIHLLVSWYQSLHILYRISFNYITLGFSLFHVYLLIFQDFFFQYFKSNYSALLQQNAKTLISPYCAKMAQNFVAFSKIPDMEKFLFFHDFSLTSGNLATTKRQINLSQEIDLCKEVFVVTQHFCFWWEFPG